MESTKIIDRLEVLLKSEQRSQADELMLKSAIGTFKHFQQKFDAIQEDNKDDPSLSSIHQRENEILHGSMEITREEYYILLSVLKESIEQKRVQLEAINIRRSRFSHRELILVENLLNAEIDKHIDLLRKVTFYEQTLE